MIPRIRIRQRRRWAAALLILSLAGVLLHAPAAAAAPPNAPTNLRVTGISAFAVDLAWNRATGGEVPPGTKMLYSVFDESGEHGTWTYDGETTARVTGLDPGTTYRFTARALDGNWQFSPHSNAVTVTTAEVEPLPVPANLRVTENTTGTEITIAFDVADDPRVISYRLLRDGQPTWVSAVPGQDSVTIDNLHPETSYDFALRSVMWTDDWQEYEGEPSAPLTATTSRDTVAPTTPRTLDILDRTGISVDLRWSGSHDFVGVTAYVIDDGHDTHVIPASPARPTSETIDGLTPETGYTFTVRARDAAGNLSAPSPVRSIATGVHPDVTPPAPVTGLQGSRVDEFTSVSWNPTTDDVTLQRALRYRVTTDGGDDITLPAGVTSHTGEPDMGDTPLRGCLVTVVALDRVGNTSQPRTTDIC